jgi:hypothetical protein
VLVAERDRASPGQGIAGQLDLQGSRSARMRPSPASAVRTRRCARSDRSTPGLSAIARYDARVAGRGAAWLAR